MLYGVEVVTPPRAFAGAPRPWIFLAGSIEMGAAEPWQDAFAARLSDLRGTILNPRRPDWDSSWQQTRDDPRFSAQVKWELDAQEAADLVPMYFSPSTRSPITLLELGLFARTKKLIVCCPDAFWRKGNVDIVCDRYGVETARDLAALERAIRSKLL